MRMTGKHPHKKFRISGQQTLAIIITGTELFSKPIQKDTTSIMQIVHRETKEIKILEK